MSNKTKIYFIFPTKSDTPVGGYKIAFQYADFFSSIGYEVHLILPFAKLNFFSSNISLFKKVKTFFGFYYRLWLNQIDSANWYDFKNSIKKDFIFHLAFISRHKFPKKSIMFATSVETAYAIAKLKLKNKFYLIQDYENWNGNSDDYVNNSYHLGFYNIVISKWLQQKVEDVGETAVLIPNGLDFDYFKLDVPIISRKSTEVSMLFHLDDRKRCVDAIKALELVKEKIPELHVSMFGVPEKPDNLPQWFSYYQKPDKDLHNYIYNNSAIFIAASMKEGWALPPAEAMQCGNALVCTDIGGFKDYAINNETALLSTPYNPEDLAKNILKLIENSELRIKLAENGYKLIQEFTVKKMFTKMAEIVSAKIR